MKNWVFYRFQDLIWTLFGSIFQLGIVFGSIFGPYWDNFGPSLAISIYIFRNSFYFNQKSFYCRFRHLNLDVDIKRKYLYLFSSFSLSLVQDSSCTVESSLSLFLLRLGLL